ncbi:MAG: esterase [Chitinophagaceae bacterium]|nr:esterase [Chitinophagaceae bacterium]
MKRDYYKWYSHNLGKDMELLVFGTEGSPVILFPTRTARFYDYENWKVIDSISAKIEAGYLQVFCVDSYDIESFYNKQCPPADRMHQHLRFEQYILDELLPLIRLLNLNPFIITAGCSLGAYHAVNITLRYPQIFGKAVGLSGRFDLTTSADSFPDLFDGYLDEQIIKNMPSRFVPGCSDEATLELWRKLQLYFAVGKLDPFACNNLLLHQALKHKGVPNQLDFYEGEAHRCSYWCTMLPQYL